MFNVAFEGCARNWLPTQFRNALVLREDRYSRTIVAGRRGRRHTVTVVKWRFRHAHLRVGLV